MAVRCHSWFLAAIASLSGLAMWRDKLLPWPPSSSLSYSQQLFLNLLLFSIILVQLQSQQGPFFSSIKCLKNSMRMNHLSMLPTLPPHLSLSLLSSSSNSTTCAADPRSLPCLPWRCWKSFPFPLSSNSPYLVVIPTPPVSTLTSAWSYAKRTGNRKALYVCILESTRGKGWDLFPGQQQWQQQRRKVGPQLGGYERNFLATSKDQGMLEGAG